MEKGCATIRLYSKDQIDAYVSETVDINSDNGPEEALAIEDAAYSALQCDGFYEVAI